jgi:hypothetical protein
LSFVLRPISEDGKSNPVGEFYVHSIMHDEIVKGGELKFDAIDLA